MAEEDEVLVVVAAADATVEPIQVNIIADKLRLIRRCGIREDMHSALGPSLQRGGAGVYPWIKNRLYEFGCLPPCCGSSENISRVTCELHFWPWDTERYGEFDDVASSPIEEKKRSTQRSPLSRLIDANPINIVAHRVSTHADALGWYACTACNQQFRNRAALGLHFLEKHSGNKK